MLKSSYINFIILILIVNVKCFPISNSEGDELTFHLLGSEVTSNKQESGKRDEKSATKSDTRCLPTQFMTGGFDFTTGGGSGSSGGIGGGGGLGPGGIPGNDGGIGIDQDLPPGEILRRRRIQAARIARARRIRRMRMMQVVRRRAIRREMDRRKTLANNRPNPNVNGGAPMPSDNQPVNIDNTDNIDDADNLDNMGDVGSDGFDNSEGSDGDLQYDQPGVGDYN